MTTHKATRQFLTLSFSGAGHLLPYHLGVSWSLLQHIRLQESKKRIPTHDRQNKKHSNETSLSSSTSNCPLPLIKAVAGSSSGAIAAVMFSKLPHRIEEYAEQFIETRGKAIETLASMLHDEEIHWTSTENGRYENSVNISIDQKMKISPTLHIATTRCKDGSPYLFRFCNNETFSTISSSWNTDSILEAVKASCTIPASFHPSDLFPSKLWDKKLSYPDHEGICIKGQHYIDGGIAAPAPTIPTVTNKNATKSIIVSPISYGNISDSKGDTSFHRISPDDNSWRLLPFQNIKFRNDFLVRPSVQNVRALRIASGMASSIELRGWYERGIEDADKMVEEWK